MRTAIKETTVYTAKELKELFPSGFERALEKNREWQYQDDFWSEYIIDDAKEAAEKIGIYAKNIYWSGFGSQGDGACFEGDYAYKKGSVKEIKKYYPHDMELQRIAEDLAAIQKRWFYGITASVEHRGHYYHEHQTVIEVSTPNTTNIGYHSYETENERGMAEDIQELLRDFMCWIYKQLKVEAEYMGSEEYFLENAEANDWEFDEDGNIQ